MQRKEAMICGVTVKRFVEVLSGPAMLTNEEALEVIRLLKLSYPQITELMEGLKKKRV